jgi:hypothetical protein
VGDCHYCFLKIIEAIKKSDELSFCHKKPSGINLAYPNNNLQLSTICQVVIFFMRGTPEEKSGQAPQYLAHFYHFCEKISVLIFFAPQRHKVHKDNV